ncbi:MAG: hypothetical protein K2K32_01180 [Muribaculaceae bacterium]|nr:hypothetical protein [Muribaculaceae bacterium]
MKTIFKYISVASLAVLTLGASTTLSSCSDDTLDTNPYNRKGVNIVAMGPMPVSRGEQIRISGTQLNKVKAVIFPGAKDIASEERSNIDVYDFQRDGNEEISVRVPELALAGHLALLTESGDTITSLSNISFVEEISIESVSPLTDLSAGDIITVKGDFIWNIASATFTDGVVVESADFLKVNRVEAQIQVPLAAVSGKLVLSDGNEDNPKEFTYNVTIHTATVASLDKNAENDEEYEFGEYMTIRGSHLNLVETVTFPAGIEVPFEVNTDGTEIRVQVPEECCSGEVTLTQYSGMKVNTPAYSVPTVAVFSINGQADGVKDVMVGDEITLKGKNFDRIKEFYFPGESAPSTAYTLVDAETITFTAYEGMLDGTIRIVQNNSISIETPSISMKKMGNVVWQGNVECAGWSGSFGIYTWSGADWDYWTQEVFTEPGVLTLHFDNPNGATLKLTRSGDWSTPFDNVKNHEYANPDDASILNVPAGVTEVSFEVTADDIAAIQESGFTLYGDGYTLTMIEYKKGNEVSIWSGNMVFGDWEGNDSLAWGRFDWDSVTPDSIIRFYLSVNNPGAWAFIGLRRGSDWASLPNKDAYEQIDLTGDETVVAFDLPANVLDDIRANQGIVVVGANITVTDITIE